MLSWADEGANVSQAAIILNAQKPSAAGERAERALRARGISAEVCATHSAEEGANAASQAMARGVRWVIAAGGDGTVMSVLEPVVRAGATLSLLPLGTANDFATYLEMGGLSAALQALENGVAVDLDVGECEYAAADGRPARGLFTSTAGVGVMGRLAELEDTRAAGVLKRSLGNAVWPLLAAAATLSTRTAEARIVLDGKELRRKIAAFEVTKVPKAGGIELAPDAGGDSGMLHAWLAEGDGAREHLHTLRHALRGAGQLLASRHVQYISRDPRTNAVGAANVRTLEITCTPAMPLHLNGDHVGATPARFTLHQAALRVLVPRESALARGMRAVLPLAESAQ